MLLPFETELTILELIRSNVYVLLYFLYK